MKLTSLLTSVLLCIVLFSSSCKKSGDDVMPVPPSENTADQDVWIGKFWYADDPQTTYNYTFVFKNATEVTVINGLPGAPEKSCAKGTYTVDEGLLKIKYAYPNNALTFYVAAKNAATKLVGNWGGDENVVSGGFYVDKQ